MNIQDEIKRLFSKADQPGVILSDLHPKNNYKMDVKVTDMEGKELESKRAKIDKARSELNAHLRRSAERGRYKPKFLNMYMTPEGKFAHFDNDTLEPADEYSKKFHAHQSKAEWKRWQRESIRLIKNSTPLPSCLIFEPNVIEQ